MRLDGVACALCVAALLNIGPAHAVDVGTQESVTNEYQDRLIDGGTLAPDVSDTPDDYDQGGWPRSIRIEGVTSRLKRNGASVREDGVAAGAFSIRRRTAR